MSPSLGKHLAKRVVRVAALSAACVALVTAPTVSAQTCPFDNGGSTLENDGLVLTRYALGLRGAAMVANTSFAAADAPTIESTIACPSCGLRVTDDKDALNNPIFTVADATIISRKIAGFSGDTLTNGIASLGSGTRNTPAAVQSFLLAGCGATGGTVTSVTAGTGLTGGTFTTSGTLAADTTYLQRRVSTACAAGSYVTAIAADGTPSCGTPAVGGSGTVTSVGAGYGLVANGPNVVGNAVVSNGLIELANGYILPQGCTAGQVPKSAGNGSWNCAADNTAAGAGGGTVTSITLGDGLTSNVALPFTSGGVITSAGTITLPVPYRLPQTCAIGQVPQLQFGRWECVDLPASAPVLPTCLPGQVLRFTVTGTLQCGTLPHTITIVDGAGSPPLVSPADVGAKSSIVVPADGLPFIAYTDATNSNAFPRVSLIKVMKCSTPTCTGERTVSTITNEASNDNPKMSVAIAANGFPVIAYYGLSSVYLASCANASCSAGTVLTFIGFGGTNSLDESSVSIAVPADGLPLVTHHQSSGTGAGFRVKKCADTLCTTYSDTLLAPGSANGKNSSIAFSASGLPMIAYWSSDDLVVVTCGNASCSAGNTVRTVDSVGDGGRYAAVVRPSDGRPFFAHALRGAGVRPATLVVAKCNDSSCSGAAATQTLDVTEGIDGASMALAADGLPILSYNSYGAFAGSMSTLKFVKCGNANCSNGNYIVTLDKGGGWSSLFVPSDGLPIISYFDLEAKDLKVLKCSNSDCRLP